MRNVSSFRKPRIRDVSRLRKPGMRDAPKAEADLQINRIDSERAMYC